MRFGAFLRRGRVPSGLIRVATLEGLARAADPSAVRTLQGHTDKITCLASPDLPTKNYLLSGSADCTVRVWNLEYARAAKNAGTELCAVLKALAARRPAGLHGATARLSRCTRFRTTRARSPAFSCCPSPRRRGCAAACARWAATTPLRCCPSRK